MKTAASVDAVHVLRAKCKQVKGVEVVRQAAKPYGTKHKISGYVSRLNVRRMRIMMKPGAVARRVKMVLRRATKKDVSLRAFVLQEEVEEAMRVMRLAGWAGTEG